MPSAGGARRNPKRKNVKVASLHQETPSESDIDRAFEKYLADMSQTATWADHNPIQAFADAYGVVVQLYRKEGESKTNRQLITPNINGGGDIERPMVHIAYHVSCARPPYHSPVLTFTPGMEPLLLHSKPRGSARRFPKSADF